ncbi:hypothetical protein CAL29_05280 [Bordetella genomosp. 10]|uniref:Uncharacterized protein n=2 Tax=Bordetella genomosp. 10 TaxID=1416804 RepID=A0A261SK29_9BORD|nr:hypothetical protein CAL29_05280 [Bordetella genomosp. 10]
MNQTAASIERLFKEARRLVALIPALEPGDDIAAVAVFEKEILRCAAALPPKPIHIDAAYRQALLGRLQRCKHLPAETLLLILDRAFKRPAWILQAERELGSQAGSAMQRMDACLRPEQGGEKLQRALGGIFLSLPEESPDPLGGRMGMFLALSRLPPGMWLLYQRSLPFAVVNEARQALPRHPCPRPP